MTTKLCRDCQHWDPHGNMTSSDVHEFSWCTRDAGSKRSLITGQLLTCNRYCDQERASFDSDRCGPDARFFLATSELL